MRFYIIDIDGNFAIVRVRLEDINEFCTIYGEKVIATGNTMAEVIASEAWTKWIEKKSNEQ